MRLLSGMILGVLLTVGIAYVHDSTLPSASSANPIEKPMVNWDVVSENVHTLVARAQAQWRRFTGAVEPPPAADDRPR